MRTERTLATAFFPIFIHFRSSFSWQLAMSCNTWLASGIYNKKFSFRLFLSVYEVVTVIKLCVYKIVSLSYIYRRDRGFSYRLLPMQYETLVNATRHIPADPVCYGSVTFVYLIPSILHMLAYLYTVYLFRVKENEQLQNLMERAFLLSSNPVNRGNQRRLVHILWLFIGLSIVWMTVALLIVNVMMARGSIIFQWLEFR